MEKQKWKKKSKENVQSETESAKCFLYLQLNQTENYAI